MYWHQTYDNKVCVNADQAKITFKKDVKYTISNYSTLQRLMHWLKHDNKVWVNADLAKITLKKTSSAHCL